jgi:hypothetical protein
LGTEISLDFVASGRGGQGNSASVRYLVKKLRDAGNMNVWGVVDQDGRADAPPGIVFNAERYAIENLTLDPLILGAFLLREAKLTSSDLGLGPDLRHFDLGEEHAQLIVGAMSSAVLTTDSDRTSVAVQYAGGFQTTLPAFWLTTNGHDLERRVCDVYQPLKAFGKNLGREVISRGFGDLPDFIPCSVIEMLEQILELPAERAPGSA